MMEARKMFSPNGCGSKPLLSSRANADEYVVEKILQRRKQEGCETSPSADGFEYMIKWKGYNDTENTWEPFQSLAGNDGPGQAYEDFMAVLSSTPASHGAQTKLTASMFVTPEAARAAEDDVAKAPAAAASKAAPMPPKAVAPPPPGAFVRMAATPEKAPSAAAASPASISTSSSPKLSIPEAVWEPAEDDIVWFKFKYLPFWPTKVTEVGTCDKTGKTLYSLIFFGDETAAEATNTKKMVPFKHERYAEFKKAGLDAQEKNRDAGLFMTAVKDALEEGEWKDEDMMALAPKVELASAKGKKRKKSSGALGGAQAAKAARAAPKDRNAPPVPRERVPLRQAPKPIAANIGAYFAAKHKFNPPLPSGPPPLPKMAPPPELLAAAAKAKAAAAAAAAAATDTTAAAAAAAPAPAAAPPMPTAPTPAAAPVAMDADVAVATTPTPTTAAAMETVA